MAPLSVALAKEGFDSIVQATQGYRIGLTATPDRRSSAFDQSLGQTQHRLLMALANAFMPPWRAAVLGARPRPRTHRAQPGGHSPSGGRARIRAKCQSTAPAGARFRP